MEFIAGHIIEWLVRHAMLNWVVSVNFLPVWIRALSVSRRAQLWLNKANMVSGGTNGEALPLVQQGERIYRSIESLELPVPDIQFVSPQGDPEPINNSLGRMKRYINIFCILAEDIDGDKRFGKKLFQDSKEYLESQCRFEKNKYIFDRLRQAFKQ